MPLAQRLVTVSRELSEAQSLSQIHAVVSRAARELVHADGATFVLRDGAHCVHVDENAVAPLWKGRRFPLSACIEGWCIQHGSAAVAVDVYADERIPHDVYRATFVRSTAVVPIRRSAPVGAIGVYWRTRHEAGESELAVLQALADSASVAMEQVGLDGPRLPLAELSRRAGERCRNLYRFIRLRLGPDISDRELARRWGMNWRSFLNLKEGSRRVPRLEELEHLAELLGIDASLVLLVARGEPADVVNRWLLDGDEAVRDGILSRLGLSGSGTASRLLHARIDRIPCGIVTIDLRGCVRDSNARLAAIVADEERLQVGAHFISFLAPDSAAEFLKLEARALEDGEAGPAPVRLEHGRVVSMSLTAVNDAEGRTLGFQGLLQSLPA